jgi:hypothetical protein
MGVGARMTNREFARIGKAVAERIPGFESHGSILALRPVTHTLRGLQFESDSSEGGLFYVWRFFLPLCVPTEHVTLNFGERLKGTASSMWDGRDPSTIDRLVRAVESEAVPFLAPLGSPRDVARAILQRNALASPHTWQAAAYMFAREGNGVAALDALSHLIDRLDPGRVAWHEPMLERARWLADRVVAKPREVEARLSEWEQQTIRHLGLEALVRGDER